MTLQATSTYVPKLMNVLGFEEINVTVSATSPFDGSGQAIDLALVLDVTDSMSFDGKIESLQSAVNHMLSNIEEDDLDIRVSIIPFSQYVRVTNDPAVVPFWVDASEDGTNWPAREKVQHGTCLESYVESCTKTDDGHTYDMECTRCTLREPSIRVIETKVKEWEGCVGSRSGIHALYPEHNGQDFTAIYDNGPDKYSCPLAVLPLTDDITRVRTTVSSLSTSGQTYLPAGLAWGWRTLDNNVPFDASAIDGNPRRKILVAMTDGANTMSRENASTHLHIGLDQDDADTRSLELCQTIKDNDIEVISIAYALSASEGSEADTKAMLRTCSSGQFYDATNATQLTAAFDDIAQSLLSVRLSH